ncbi:MAG TPA: hypothetical protein VGC65_02865 [Bacteroidia bacterium]|jgi:hypothetical protein
MKKLLFSLIVLSACTSTEQENNTAPGHNQQGDSIQSYSYGSEEKRRFNGKYADKTSGAIRSFHFSGEDSVIIDIAGELIPTNYVREVDIIKVKHEQNGLILSVKDDTTLIGQGIIGGALYFKE